MYSLVFYFAVLLIIQNTTSAKAKVYVIDLADTDPNNKVSELLKLLAKSRETPFKEAKHAGYDESNENDCLMDLATTKQEKIKCLTQIQRNKLGVNSRKPEFSQFYAQRPKRKIYSLYNYYGGLLKPTHVTDYTRQEFSQDYLDLGDLSRLEKCTHSSCRHSDHRRLKDVSDEISNISPDSRRRIIKDSEDSSSGSDKSSESSEERTEAKEHKPNRFQVVFNEDSSVEYEEEKPKKPKKSYSSESEEKRWSSEEKKPKKSRDKFAYLQGNRIYDVRRRLQHFLPKRFHWDEDDMYHNLGYYWFDAPKDKYQ